MASDVHWALPQLLRAFREGHRSHRGRVLRLIGSLDDQALSSEPVLSAFRATLHGPDGELARRVGALVTARGLSAYSADLVALLCSSERRELADTWLRRPGFPFPKAETLGLVLDRESPLAARQTGLRLLRRRAPLQRQELLELLALLHDRRLHTDLLPLLLPHADASMVAAAVEANTRFGQELLRAKRRAAGAPEEPGLLHRLLFFSEVPSSIGLFASQDVRRKQRPFVEAIAKLAIASGSQEWLAALLEQLFTAGLTQPLKIAYVEHDVRRIGAPLLARPVQGAQLPVKIELLGQLGVKQAARFLIAQLPPFGREAGAAGRAAILALARLGKRESVAPYLDGALAAFRQARGDPPQGTPGHPSTWAVAFQAATALGDQRFGEIGLEILASRELFRILVELDLIVAECLSVLAPLELEPTVRRVLSAEDAYPGAQRIAVEIIERCGLRTLIDPLVALAGRVPTVASLAARTLRKMLRQDDGPLALAFFDQATPDDASADALLARCEDILPLPQQREIAGMLLERGAGGVKAQRRALRLISEGDRETFLRVCAGLLASSHGEVVTAALRAGISSGLLEEGGRFAPQLLARVRLTIAGSATDDSPERRQLRMLLKALLPPQGLPGLDRDATAALRRRLAKCGQWTELPTFLSVHRDLTRLAVEGVDLGLLHGALLGILAERTFFHPVLGTKGPYQGPLPRFDDVFALPSPYVQEGLFTLVCGAGYLRTERVLLRFLDSPRARIRAGVLGRLKRETFLNFSPRVLARASDDAPQVRLALIDALANHELARFSEHLRPLLDDADERVRLSSARTLGVWGDASCLSRMVEFLTSEEVGIRREASQALARLDPDVLTGRLAEHINQEDPRATAAALHALNPQRLPKDDALGAAIFELAAKGRGPLRGLALHFLPALAQPSRLGEVVPLLADAQPDVRRAAAYVLARRDGRKHAPAIVDLATRTSEADVRRELLALLGELGVPEAARGLVPLLLAEDPHVRAAVRQAVVSGRGFSIQPELEKALAQGLETRASPDAIRELVELLHREGDDEAFVAIAEALRCEDRAVWEAVLAAAHDRGAEHAVAHFPRLLESLGASPPLPSALLTLALGEAERDAAGRERLQKKARALARAESSAETVKRRALLAAFHCSSDETDLAAELAKGAAARVKQLEAQKPKKKTDVRAELTRTAGTLTTSARVGVESTGDPVQGLKAVPKEALRGALPWTLLQIGFDAALRDPTSELPKGLLKALERLVPAGSTPAATRLARTSRDRLTPSAFLALCESINPDKTLDLLRARLTAELRTSALDLAGLPARLKAVPNDQWPATVLLLLGIIEHWKPDLRGALPLVIGEFARRGFELEPQSWSRRRSAEALYGALVGVKLRLGDRTGSETLHALRPTGRLDLMTAEADVAGLQTLLAENRDDELPIQRLGEVGGPEAAHALAAHAAHRTPAFRAAVAQALGETRAPQAAREPLSKLLGDSEPSVQAAALRAVAALEDASHEAAVRYGLGSEHLSVLEAACEATQALKLDSALPLLRVALLREDRAARAPVLSALAAVADASILEPLVEIGRTVETPAACALLVPALLAALGETPSDAALDRVGALLGEAAPYAPVLAARVFADGGQRRALPALRALAGDPQVAALARASACEALRRLGDPQAFATIHKALSDAGPGKQERLSLLNVPTDMRGEAALLLAATCPSEEQETVRAFLHTELTRTHSHSMHATPALALLPATPETVQALASKLDPADKRFWSQAEAQVEGLRALAVLDPEAGGRSATKLWDRLAADPRADTRALEAWLETDAGGAELEPWRDRISALLAGPQPYHARRRNQRLRSFLLKLAPEAAADQILRGAAEGAADAQHALAELCARGDARPEWIRGTRSLLLAKARAVRVAARRALAKAPAPTETSAYAAVLEAAQADDPDCTQRAVRLIYAAGGSEVAGELLVDLFRIGTPAARAALLSALRTLDPNTWPGFKRVFKLNEGAPDPELFALQAFVLDQARSWRKPSFRTISYMRRRSYRLLKAMGHDAPESFREVIRLLLIRFAEVGPHSSELLTRILRDPPHASADETRFVATLENPFTADTRSGKIPDLIDLSDEALLTTAPAPEAPPASTATPSRTQAWKGPLHAELWTQDASQLVGLLGAATHSPPVLRVLLALLRERVGDRVLAVPLDSFYELLDHASPLVSRYALGQIAARARRELIRFGLLVPVFVRLLEARPLDWDGLADLLWVLDDERAQAERAGLAQPLLELIASNPEEPGVGPVVGFFRQHLSDRLAPPHVDWPLALRLASAGRPDVRELGRDAVRALNDVATLEPTQILKLLAADALIETAPDLVHQVLTHSPACPEGYRPPERWPIADCAEAARELGELGFQALRRALLSFETHGGLPLGVALALLGGAHTTRRARALGMELFSSAVARDAVPRVELTRFLLDPYCEDVVVWASEHLSRAAAAGQLSNEGVYRLLDATGQAVNAFARDLVDEHLRQFETAELIVFCAESPDAATSALGVTLYERELKSRGYDLATLLPMFRILLFKVASARAEKRRLLATLRRWALESAENSRLVVDVIAAFRRSEAKLEFSNAMTLLVLLGERFPEVELPFATSHAFGHQR